MQHDQEPHAGPDGTAGTERSAPTSVEQTTHPVDGTVAGALDATSADADAPARPEPPVSQLADVPPEEWSYWTAQAWAGCGVVLSLLLAMFLPLILSALIGNTTGKLIGFGISGFVGLLSVAVISRLTYRKRQERRETMRMGLAERPAAPRDTPDDLHA